MNLKQLLLLPLMVAGLAVATTRAQTVNGTIIDAQSREPLAGANVVQSGTNNGTATDGQGHFELQLVEDATQSLQISFVGYKQKKVDLRSYDHLQDLEIRLVPKAILSGEVFVEALRVDEASPMAYENISRQEIQKKNLAQDMPYMVSTTPSVVTTSDAGTGIGYTSLRIRGVDQNRINVTINGIPVNDAESHGVFWVDMPDLAASVDNIQIQRGVGTSTNGAGAFGATMNLQTSMFNANPYAETNSTVGSFNTRKFNVKVGSGLMKNGWEVNGRLSKIASDGYIDRASSDLKSFYLSASRHGDKSLLKADVFSGWEETYQAWYGVPESMLDTDRTYNPAGMERPGSPYDNQIDHYQQDHYQLHYSYQFTDSWNANLSLHYTYGRGYYEEYKADQQLSDYKLNPIAIGDTSITQSDLVRRKWLDNDFYGIVFSSNYKAAEKWSFTVGGGYNEYDGGHFGRVIWEEYGGTTDVRKKYYNNDAFKTDFNIYGKYRYFFSDALTGYADLQYRHITYDFLGKDTQRRNGSEVVVDVKQADRLSFINPKVGLVYRPNPHQRLFASFSVGNKEPTRDEYVNSTPESRPKHETLYDWEAGYKTQHRWFTGEVNLYYMDYKNQLILTGEVNDVGSYIRQNVPDSYRAGIELQTAFHLTDGLQWTANATFSRNKIDEYTQYLDNYDTGQQVEQTYTDTDIAFSPSFIGHSILSYNNKGFSSEWTAKYVSKQYLDNTQSERRKIDSYFVHNLRIGYTFDKVPYLQNIRASLEVNNLFDKAYETNGYTYGYISGGSEQYYDYYYPQAGRHYLFKLQLRF